MAGRIAAGDNGALQPCLQRPAACRMSAEPAAEAMPRPGIWRRSRAAIGPRAKRRVEDDAAPGCQHLQAAAHRLDDHGVRASSPDRRERIDGDAVEAIGRGDAVSGPRSSARRCPTRPRAVRPGPAARSALAPAARSSRYPGRQQGILDAGRAGDERRRCRPCIARAARPQGCCVSGSATSSSTISFGAAARSTRSSTSAARKLQGR